jgi:VCBS repeat-containing protein
MAHNYLSSKLDGRFSVKKSRFLDPSHRSSWRCNSLKSPKARKTTKLQMNPSPTLTRLSRQLKFGISLSATIFMTGASQAQLAGSGTPGDRAIYSLAAGKLGAIDDVTALPSSTLTWDFDNAAAILVDNADSFDLGAEGGADETKVFLTGGHHLVLFGGQWDAVDERSNPVNYLKLNGSAIPYGTASGYTRDANTKKTVVRGGTIINVAQGDYLEVESLRTDIYMVNEPRTITQVDGDLQLLKLDDSGLDFLRLSRSTSTAVMPANNEGPTAIGYEVQDEISASSFDHSISVNPEQVTLKATGHYLILANTGFTISPATQRNAITQTLKLNGVAIDGGVTQVYLRNSAANDVLGGLGSDGAVSVGVLVEVTSPNSVLTVEVTRDNNNSSSAVTVDHTRTGLAIAKLPVYGEFISLNGSAQDVNTGSATARDFSASADVSNPSFTYTSGTSASQVVVNKSDDVLFLSSFFAAETAVTRGVVRHGFSTTSGGPVSYGASSSYARNQPVTAADGAEAVGNWAGAILSGLSIGDGVEVTTGQIGIAGAINATPSIQALNISSISMPPPIPVIAINNIVGLTVNDPAYTLANTDLGTTDGNNTSAELTYTLNSQPSGGTLKKSGVALNNGETFTQDDIDNSLMTFEEGGVETDPGGFDFTVRDPALNSESGTFVIRVIQAISVSADTASSDEDTVASESQLSAGANLLSNDTGNSLTVTTFDAVSTNGAAVSVNPDGTFTYDPLAVSSIQQLSVEASIVDTFTYTVTDTIGKTATATVTITVAGANDAPEAMPDVLNDGPLEDASSFVSTRDLTQNDGSYRLATPMTFPAGSDLRLLPGKISSQTPSVGTPPGNGFPDNAFDGNTGTFTHTQANNNTVDHVWQVDFVQDVSLENVTLIGRLGNTDRFRDITVSVLDSVGIKIFESGLLNPTTAPLTIVPSLFVDFSGPLTGRTLVVTRTPDLGDANSGNGSILSLAEVIVIGSSPGSYPVDDLLLNYDAANSAGAGRWENQGTSGGTNADWVLTGVTLDPSPGSARAQISAAYEWDSTADATQLSGGVSASIHDNVGADTADATWEFWVKPANTSSVMTLFETGGGVGFGAIINNGILEAATELDGGTMDGSYVSYDLVNDPQGLVGGDPTTEFNQYAVTITVNGGLQLYVNGVLVDETTSGVSNDWDGGDGAGLGRFGEANHGGFINAATGTAYDAPFLGQMAIVRLYSGVLSGAEIFQNFNAVNGDTDIDGDTISAIGVIDGSDAFVANGSPATLSSGAIVTMSNATGGFDYNPNGVFSLAPGATATDTFTYRVSDGNGATAEAEVAVTITGIVNDLVDDNLLAKEGESKAFFANAIVGNDEDLPTASDPYVSLTPDGISGAVWTNTGNSGAGRNATGVASVSAQELESNFGQLGAAATVATSVSLDAISLLDATLEVWFKPTLGQTGKKTIFETGGNGIGFSLVFDPSTNEVIATIDGGTDGVQDVRAVVPGVVTSDFNQVIVVFDRDGGAEVGVASGIFEDIMTVYLNNDPITAFDGTADATVVDPEGDANDWSGSDGIGINRVSGTSALDENFAGMDGEVAIVRVYTRILTAAEMELNYDAAVQAIVSVTSPTTPVGSTVTLNADGSVTVDYTSVSLVPGGTLVDSFTYTIDDGAGGSNTADVNVLIEGNTLLEDWRFSYYGDIANSGAGADGATANNGLTNLQSFALDLDPTAAAGTLDVDAGAGTITSLGPPAVWIDPADGRVYLRHTRRADFAAIPLTITDEFSRDLTAFETSVVDPSVIATGIGDSGAVIEAVQTEFPLVLPVGGGKARFGRVDVTNP